MSLLFSARRVCTDGSGEVARTGCAAGGWLQVARSPGVRVREQGTVGASREAGAAGTQEQGSAASEEEEEV